jgi:hypothetical protein
MVMVMPQQYFLIQQNPFHLLGATLRDNARRIVELADEKALILDDEICQKARSDLTTPNMRLAAEVRWLPGISPSKAEELIRALQTPPVHAQETTGLPPLVCLNLEAAKFQWQGNASDVTLAPTGEVAGRIRQFSRLWEAIDPEQVRRDLNEDRAVSGFPEIRGVEQIETELAELRRRHRDIVKELLDRMTSESMVETMSKTVRSDPIGDEAITNAFLDGLVDAYQEESRVFLDGEAAKIEALVKSAKDGAEGGAGRVSPIVADIEKVATVWAKVAAPIQLSLKARGIQHDASHHVAIAIRDLGITLFNAHGMLEQAEQITGILQRLFPYVPDVAARIAEDAEAVDGIRKSREKVAAEQEEWVERITYRTEVGVLFRKKLSISPDGIEWNGERYPLDSITRVRWGGVRRSVNGLPTGTTYTIAVGDNTREAVIHLDGTRHQAFIERLWPAVCVRLMTSILGKLKEGRELVFGDALLIDLGLTLTKHKMFGAKERVFCDWWHIQTWSRNGSFYIQSKDDTKVCVTLSYLSDHNTHLLEHLIGLKFKASDKKISALLG